MISLFLVYTLARSADALTHAIPIEDGAPRSCVEAELRRRLVRVKSDRTICSGVVVDPIHVRSAGRCFGLFPGMVWTEDARGTRRFDEAVVRRNGGVQYLGFGEPDQAEIEFKEPISDFAPVERADAQTLGAGTRVVMAGFGFSGMITPWWRTFVTPSGPHYAFGRLRVITEKARPRGKLIYEITPEDPAVRIAQVDVGGPVFVVDGCNLRWFGTILARRLPLGRGTTRIFARPHNDLN